MFVDLFEEDPEVCQRVPEKVVREVRYNVYCGIHKDATGSGLLTEMRVQVYYQHLRAASVMMRHKSVGSLVESLNSDDSGSKSLAFSGSYHIEPYMATVEELPIFITVGNNFVENGNKPVPFHESTLHTSAKMYLGELRIMSVDRHTESAL